MSFDIWTQCGGLSNARRMERSPYRVVEFQHRNSTRQLVDSDDEQAILEDLIDGAKPPHHPASVRAAERHYLLTSPFRYPPLRHGSRFGGAEQRGIWYGAERLRTALVETAYYRLAFLHGTAANLAPLIVELTSFRTKVSSRCAIDLTLSPFAAFRPALTSKVDYRASQQLGRAMRQDGVDFCRYFSSRDKEGGINIAVFNVASFSAAPYDERRWRCVVQLASVEFQRLDLLGQTNHLRLNYDDFTVDGVLPPPCS